MSPVLHARSFAVSKHNASKRSEESTNEERKVRNVKEEQRGRHSILFYTYTPTDDSSTYVSCFFPPTPVGDTSECNAG